MNKTLNEQAKSMSHVGLPKMFWANVVSIAAHLINRGPSVPLDHQFLKECWTRKKVNLSYLRIFGWLSYVHVDYET
ncbi:unnamed protein product [Spirodela intermedia]|uniref:Uncharacterized protein n=1 Tax=Spirodela intermedia TaxID=51605 RepID=A0A7I8JXR9_SPIIN|nr:unnamed protein product [Spirodela intermedia]